MLFEFFQFFPWWLYVYAAFVVFVMLPVVIISELRHKAKFHRSYETKVDPIVPNTEPNKAV